MSDFHNISQTSHDLVDHTLIELVNQVPTEPGCYMWKNAAGKVLYVGKAKNLRARMRQYVHGTD
ncbi:MAG: nucleotide excision repair endonuclease, partial [Atopobium minutum]|nr:nucleotide excision repair endonuclease [Atopobium minutum]